MNYILIEEKNLTVDIKSDLKDKQSLTFGKYIEDSESTLRPVKLKDYPKITYFVLKWKPAERPDTVDVKYTTDNVEKNGKIFKVDDFIAYLLENEIKSNIP